MFRHNLVVSVNSSAMNSVFIACSLLITLGSTFGLDDSRSSRILHYEFNNIGTGPYKFRFQSSDGISREEEGSLVNENTEDETVTVRGSYSYSDETGKVYSVRYTADENGFHPEGDHIKVPPFVPWNKHSHHHERTGGDNFQTGLVPDHPTTPIYLPSTPRPPIPNRFIPTTSSPKPISGNEKVGARIVKFTELEPRLQSSIANLISNGVARGLNIEAINDL